MSGTYRVSFDSLGGATSNYFSGRTVAVRGTLDVPIIAKSIQTIFQTSMTFAGKTVVYRVSDGVKMGESATQNLSVVAGSQYDISFTSPITLAGGVEYAFGVYSPSTGPGFRSSTFYSAGATFPSSPAYATFTKSEGGMRYVSGDAHPTLNGVGEPGWGLYFDAPNALPTAPTGITTNSPKMQTQALTVNWTHNDPDSNPQSKYQIRYRPVDV